MKHLLSYWERSVLLRPFDFAILGAGLIGKQIAIQIRAKYPDARIALIDRSPISYGASTRNAGFACFGSITEILDDFRLSPEEDVIALAEKRYKGIQQLVSDFGEKAIGYKACGSYEVFTDRALLQQAKEHLPRVNQLLSARFGIDKVFELRSADQLQMHCEDEVVFNPYEGMLNSGMLNEVVGAKVLSQGVVPLYGLEVIKLNKAYDAYTLDCDNGLQVTCHQLILANNAFAAPFLPEEDIHPARGQVLVTKPIDHLPFDHIFHSDMGYVYFRSIDGRVLIGGGRNKFREQENVSDFEGTNNVRQYLEDYLRQVVLPGRDFEIDMHWSGIMAMGPQKMPIVKRVDNNLLLCVRMSGMGVALGPILSREIADLV
jgi:gamma-glutamylputrescine oxidase